MIANLPINPADMESAHPRASVRAATESGENVDSGLAFALLFAAGDAEHPVAEEASDLSAQAALTIPAEQPQDTAAILFAAADGKILPQGGPNLPVTEVQAPVPDDDGEEQGLARMLRMVRALNGASAANGDETQGGAFRVSTPTTPGMLVEGRAEASPSQQLHAAAAPATSPVVQASGAPAAAAPPAVPISVPPSRPEWAEAVGQRVLWMVNNKAQHAQLRLNPPELGPVEVRVRIDDDGLKLGFASGNAGVREALEAAAPRLREMMQAEGLQLEQLDIGQRHASSDERERAEGDPAGQPGDAKDTGDGSSLAAGQTRGAGLVDVFV